MKFKFLKCVISAVIFFSAMTFANFSSAQIVTDKVPMLTYAEQTVKTYDNPGGKQIGFISPHVSLVMIKEIRADGWAYGSYPIASGKRVNRWFRMRDLQGFENFSNYTTSFEINMTVYRTTSESSRKTGSISAKQEVLVVGETGNQLKIIYKVGGGGTEYKMGWIDIPQPQQQSDEYYDEEVVNEGGNNSTGGNNITVTGPVYYVGGNVSTEGSINASYNDNSKTDNSYNDNSSKNVRVNNDNSYNDNRQNNNINNIDNSLNTNNIDVNRGGGKKNLLGDVNNNGKLNLSDAVDLLKYLSGENDLMNEKAADLNNDGKIDNADVVQLVKKLYADGVPVGDLNGDKKITDADLNLLKARVAGDLNAGDAKEADLNGDGRINSADVKILENLLKYLKDSKTEITL